MHTLLTIADGFGDSRSNPSWYPDFFKWPEIIGLMTKGVEIVNYSQYGAGNEYIIHCLKENVYNKNIVLVQWAMPNRLDLLLAHDAQNSKFWQDTIADDPVYNTNVHKLGENEFWLSSDTVSVAVNEYNQKFISVTQHQLRSQLYIEYAKLLLEQHQIDYKFMLTQTSQYLASVMPIGNNWVWHDPWRGMDEFRLYSDFCELDFGLAQPISLIHYDFIKKFIVPSVNLPWRSDREIAAVESMLYRKYKQALQLRPNDSYPRPHR